MRAAKEYIAAGDIFQVVLSRRIQRRTRAKPFDIYRALRRVNPSPYMFYLELPDGLRLIGSSPEVVVRLEERSGGDPSPGRHAPPRRHARARTARWPRSCWPIPRSAPST